MRLDVSLKRAYEKPSVSDGARVLVDRLWPRGLSKDKAKIDAWLRDLAPSTELRKWFHARRAQWLLFRKRYLKELREPAPAHALEELYMLADSHKKLTLVFSSKDEEHNNAVVLKELLQGMRKPPSGSGPAGATAGAGRARMRARKN
jgi:uncharacterized protein YeaO (DUF488 family)